MGAALLDLSKLFNFLQKNDWVHNLQVTNILKDWRLHVIPKEWLLHLKKLTTKELNSLPFHFEDQQSHDKSLHLPQDLIAFLDEAWGLCLPRQIDESIAPTAIDPKMARGMNPKKIHEVSRLASLVNSVVAVTDCNMIVDVGSGLGYLDHVLHQVYKHRVLGLEISESHTSAAENRAAKQGLQCGGVKSVKFDLDQSSECFHRLETLLHQASTDLTCSCCHADSSQQLRVCVIGLHCCGDLSSSVLHAFNYVPCIRALCCVCCCYHKMAYSEGKFSNFPMSKEGQRQYLLVQERNFDWSLTPFSLRLGAQESRYQWRSQTEENHADHTRHVAFRGLLELCDGFIETTQKRRLVRKCDFSSLENFIDSIFRLSALSEEAKQNMRSKLKDLYLRHEYEISHIEIFTCLQTILQPVIESAVYADRLQWLKESGYRKSRIVAVFDEALSPRNLAIVSYK